MTEGQASAIVDRLVHALNDHDLDGMLSCISASYVNDTPAHPERGFVGRDQVGSNWAQIFAGVPDVHAVVTRIAVDHETVWSEWEITGTRTDCTPLLMRGVVIFRTAGNTIAAATFYLEPVEHLTGGAEHAVQRVVRGTPNLKEHR